MDLEQEILKVGKKFGDEIHCHWKNGGFPAGRVLSPGEDILIQGIWYQIIQITYGIVGVEVDQTRVSFLQLKKQ